MYNNGTEEYECEPIPLISKFCVSAVTACFPDKTVNGKLIIYLGSHSCVWSEIWENSPSGPFQLSSNQTEEFIIGDCDTMGDNTSE